jgi:thioredoxin reductase (NADPH)
MESLYSFLIVALVTLFFVRRYVKRLPSSKRPSAARPAAPPPIPAATQACPRCTRPVLAGSAFCPACGAPLALWTVHRATVQQPAPVSASPKGRPTPVINATMCIACGSCVDACPEQGTLALAGGKAILANPDRCTGHAKCVDACPTQAIVLSFDGVLQTVRVPLVREDFQTNIPGLYIVGELGGMGLIKTAINEGRLVVDYIGRNLVGQAPAAGGLQPAAPEPTYDLIIVGAGPAGLSASLAAHQQQLQYLTLEQGEIASTIRQYPRHKFLMAEPIEMPLYGSLYITDTTKESLLSVWETIIANTGVRIQTNSRVTAIRRAGGCFEVESATGVHCGRHVVLAIGKRGSPRRLGVPGEDLGKVAYRLIEADSYEGKDVLVVGGGDSAIEAALALSRHARNRVTLSYRGDSFRRARDRNQSALAEAESARLVRVLRNSSLREIRLNAVVLDTNEAFPNDYVFVLIGGVAPDEFLQKIGVEIVEKSLAAAPAFA